MLCYRFDFPVICNMFEQHYAFIVNDIKILFSALQSFRIWLQQETKREIFMLFTINIRLP